MKLFTKNRNNRGKPRAINQRLSNLTGKKWKNKTADGCPNRWMFAESVVCCIDERLSPRWHRTRLYISNFSRLSKTWKAKASWKGPEPESSKNDACSMTQRMSKTRQHEAETNIMRRKLIQNLLGRRSCRRSDTPRRKKYCERGFKDWRKAAAAAMEVLHGKVKRGKDSLRAWTEQQRFREKEGVKKTDGKWIAELRIQQRRSGGGNGEEKRREERGRWNGEEEEEIGSTEK